MQMLLKNTNQENYNLTWGRQLPLHTGEKMTNTKYELTENEMYFMIRFMANNECGANTPDYFLGDNYSCQDMDSLKKLFDLNEQQIGGYLSSLQQKGVIWSDERIGEGGRFVKKGRSVIFVEEDLPTLYWLTEDYLESLIPDWNFKRAESQMMMINGNTPCEVYNNGIN